MEKKVMTEETFEMWSILCAQQALFFAGLVTFWFANTSFPSHSVNHCYRYIIFMLIGS